MDGGRAQIFWRLQIFRAQILQNPKKPEICHPTLIFSTKESEIVELRKKLHDQQDESDRLAAELRHTQTALGHAQEECDRLAGQDVQLAEYRNEAEKRLEQVRVELTDELEQARAETSQWRGEAHEAKNKYDRLEMELKEVAHTSEVHRTRLQEVEVERKRLETLLEETCERLKDAENQVEKGYL